MKEYDLVVIGSGAAAQTVVYDCADEGWNVALIEERSIGGTCALRGCVPKKVLYGGAEIIHQVELMKGKGVKGDKTRIDWSELIAFEKSFTDPKPASFKKSMTNAGIDVYEGHARFIDKSTVQVENETLKSAYFFIATGAMPRPLDIPGADQITTSDEFFNMTSLPNSIVFIGGGYISFELAHIAALAGADVTILHRSKRPLTQFEPDLVDLLIDATEDLGITLETEMPVHAVEQTDDGFEVIAGERKHRYSADLVMHGAGRIPNIKDLGLESADVSFTKKGVMVNEYMQSVSNPRVYAAGDVSNHGLPLTPVAGAEGKVVKRNLLSDKKSPSRIDAIPSTLFTLPPLSSVGLTEHQAKEKGLFIQVHMQETSSWYTSKRIGITHSGYKIIIDKKNNTILGAHLLGHHADEVINIFALAITYDLTVSQLKEMVWSYPTNSYDINYML